MTFISNIFFSFLCFLFLMLLNKSWFGGPSFILMWSICTHQCFLLIDSKVRLWNRSLELDRLIRLVNGHSVTTVKTSSWLWRYVTWCDTRFCSWPWSVQQWPRWSLRGSFVFSFYIMRKRNTAFPAYV